MISELKEQQVQTVICSLPHNREHMQVHLTYNTKIKTFDDIVHHLKLEKDKIKSSRLEPKAYVVNIGAQKNQGSNTSSRVGKVKERVMQPRS